MGTMAAALWDILAKAANLAQMSGLHAVMLVAVCATVLRIPQSKRECAELERCARRLARLRALLQWPSTGGGLALLCSDMGGPVGEALAEAAGLVESYKKSTLWRRVRSGRRMATQLRDMQDVVNSYCGLVLVIHAHLLIIQATHRPTSDTTTTIPEANEPSHNPSVQAVTSCSTTTGAPDTQKANDIGRGGKGSKTGNTTDPAGCERIVPAIVISHA